MSNDGGTTTTHAWNALNNDDTKYVGYMYGGANGVASTSKEQARLNETSSNAKNQLELWYTNNIENKRYGSYISDTLFCNDRRLQSEVGGPVTGPAYGEYQLPHTNYAAIYKLRTNKLPELLCGEQIDMFTVSDTTKGNGMLTYPIGLITADESSLAGVEPMGQENYNSSNFLVNSRNYWTMTPATGVATIFTVDSDESLDYYGSSEMYGLRPVINLNANIEAAGDGSATNPFKVV